jgi:hypothetical protein
MKGIAADSVIVLPIKLSKRKRKNEKLRNTRESRNFGITIEKGANLTYVSI